MGYIVPAGLDFADGVTPLPVQPYGSSGTPNVVGTPLPTANIDIFGNFGNGAFEEPPGSPKLERAEQCTCEHNLKMSWVDAQNYWAQIPRGTVLSDSEANIWRVLSCDTSRESGTVGYLHYVMESISFDSPPDEFDIDWISLDLNIIKHPRYAAALNPYITDESTVTVVGDTNIYYTEIKEAIIRMIQNYTDSPFYPSAAQVQGLIQSNILAALNPTPGAASAIILVNYPNKNFNGNQPVVDPVSWDGTNANLPTANCQFFVIGVPYYPANIGDPIVIACAASRELISKLWRGEDTPLIPGFKPRWSQFFFATVYLNPGGYIEDPRDLIPDYFMNPFASQGTIPRGDQNAVGPVVFPDNADIVAAGDGTGASIFDEFAQINPQIYSDDGTPQGNVRFSSLRMPDRYTYERTWFKVIHEWSMAPVGKWDSDLYTQLSRPQDAAQGTNASFYNNLPNAFGD